MSSNRNKVAEFESVLGFKLASVSLELPEVQSLDVAQVALRKCPFTGVRRFWQVREAQTPQPRFSILHRRRSQAPVNGHLRKAELTFALVREPVLVDDTGLYIDAWHGLSGVFTGWFFETVSRRWAARACCTPHRSDNRSATAVTALAVCDVAGSRVCVGEVKGSVAEHDETSAADGHNAIWTPDGEDRTVAATPQGRGDRVSSRAAAAEVLKPR